MHVLEKYVRIMYVSLEPAGIKTNNKLKKQQAMHSAVTHTYNIYYKIIYMASSALNLRSFLAGRAPNKPQGRMKDALPTNLSSSFLCDNNIVVFLLLAARVNRTTVDRVASRQIDTFCCRQQVTKLY